MADWLGIFAVLAASALAAGLLLALLIPLLGRIAVAAPNARSGHKLPTPQGAGIVVVPVALAAAAVVALLGVSLPFGAVRFSLAVASAAIALNVLGFVDDRMGLPVALRLLGQTLAALLILVSLPAEVRIVPWLPPVLERVLLGLALVWSINLTNFMDGMDLLSVTETLCVCFGVLVLVWIDAVPSAAAWWAAAVAGAFIGFAFWNAPPARVFLGDAGSLPLGLLLAVLMLQVAIAGAWAAALILPLYYLMDASITLLRRLARGERIWQAHREHFYQRALAAGVAPRRVVAAVAATNGLLILLAVFTARAGSDVAALAGLGAGVSVVGALFALVELKRQRP